MRVQTKPFGEIEVSEKQFLEVAEGLFGFEGLTGYVLLDASQRPFYWLQSLEMPSLAFAVLDPRVFMEDYTLDVAEEDLRGIGIERPEDVLDLVIVTIPEEARDMTANLQGPLVVNRRTRAARQCISRNPAYGVKHRIMDSLAARRR